MNPFLEFRPEDDASNYAAGQAAKAKKDKLDARRRAAMELVSKSLASTPDRMIGGGSNGSFGERPGILVPGNTVASALAGVAGAAVGQYGVSQADEEAATQAEARDKAFRDAVGEAVGGASSNVTGIPPQRDDTAMQASPNAVRANLERGMDPQLANATGVPANALQPAGMPSSGNPPPPPAQSAGNGDMSIRQLLQLAHDFPEDSKAINTLLQAKSWEGRDAAKTDNQFELAKMKLDSAAQQMAQRVTNAQEMAALKQQYALELQQLRQQFTSQQNAQYRNPAGYVAPGTVNKPPSGYQWNPDGSGSLVAIPGGPAGKPSVAQVNGMAEATNAVGQIDRAQAAVEANPDALGLKNYLPDFVMQRLDPNGVGVRAAISNIGSQIIHNRSGAAVTISETPRLLPFVPQKTDSPAAVKVKLAALRKEMEAAGMSFAPPSVAESMKQTLAPKPAATTTTKQAAKKGDRHVNSKGVAFVHDGKGWVRQ